MLFDPADHYESKETTEEFTKKSKLYERLLKWKQLFRKDKNGNGSGLKQKSPMSLFIHL
jgi:hypothetical protein